MLTREETKLGTQANGNLPTDNIQTARSHINKFKIKALCPGGAPFVNVHCGEDWLTQHNDTENPTTSQTLV